MPTRRRQFLATVGAGAALAVAGCIDGGGSQLGPGAPGDPFEGEPPELGSRVRGDSGPLIEAYTDYACSHCHTFEQEVGPELEELVENGEARLVRRDFPVPVDDPWSWRLPNLPRSAQQQTGSVEAYWNVDAHIWSNWDAAQSESFVRDAADEFDLDPDLTWEAVGYERYRPRVEADRQQGIDAGVGGTPTVFVDGESLGYPDASEVRDAVNAASE